MENGGDDAANTAARKALNLTDRAAADASAPLRRIAAAIGFVAAGGGLKTQANAVPFGRRGKPLRLA